MSALDISSTRTVVPPEPHQGHRDKSDDSFLYPLMLLCFVLIVVAFLVPFLCKRRFQVDNDDEDGEDDATSTTTKLSRKDRKERRYKMLESRLVSRRVTAHGDICDKVMLCLDTCNAVGGADDGTKPPKERSDTSTTATDDEELGSTSYDEERECPICMEHLKVGDFVSWSPNNQCNHVFHHQCVKEWLVKKTCCPFCRETFLPIKEDTNLSESKPTESQEESSSKPQETKSYFCVRHGMLLLPTDAKCCSLQTSDELNCLCSTPRLTELARMRGRQAVIAANKVEDACNMSASSQLTGGTDEIAHDEEVGISLESDGDSNEG